MLLIKIGKSMKAKTLKFEFSSHSSIKLNIPLFLDQNFLMDEKQNYSAKNLLFSLKNDVVPY